MATLYNPSIVTDGLVLCIDPANRKSISPLGCEGFSTAPQLIRNLISRSDVIGSFNGVRLGNVNFFTIFAIDYPENTFGGSAASRDGITPGYNVTSGTKVFDFGRALNYAVWNKDTETWVKTTVYDSYIGTAAVDTFVSEYNAAVQTYPRAIHVVAGSHRDGNHTTAQYNILKDLGAPSNVDSIINTSDPEWILVGEPGLGAGNAYGWAFQNYTTDSTRVAHLNMGLPIYGTKNNYLSFDGTDDSLTISTNTPYRFSNTQPFSIAAWVRCTNTSGVANILAFSNGGKGYYLTLDKNFLRTNSFLFDYFDGSVFRGIQGNNNSITMDSWVYIVATSGSNSVNDMKLYQNGVLTSYTNRGTGTPATIDYSDIALQVGARGNSGFFKGDIANLCIYDKALTEAEIQQNYNSLRKRFGV